MGTYCKTHGTLLNFVWQPGWEGSVGKDGHSIFIVSPFAFYLKLPQYYHSSPLSFFFFNRLIYLFFTELGVLAMQGMFPFEGGAGENQCSDSSLGWFPWFWGRALEQWLSSFDTWASMLQRLWVLLEPRIKPMSPAWEGRFLTTRPAGKTYHRIITGYTGIQIKIV